MMKVISLKYQGRCGVCGRKMDKGEKAVYDGRVYHTDCFRKKTIEDIEFHALHMTLEFMTDEEVQKLLSFLGEPSEAVKKALEERNRKMEVFRQRAKSEEELRKVLLAMRERYEEDINKLMRQISLFEGVNHK